MTLELQVQRKMKYKEITRKLAIFVDSSNVSNNIITNTEFSDLLTTADPCYTIPGRAALSKEIDRVLIDMKSKIGSYLQEARKVSVSPLLLPMRQSSSQNTLANKKTAFSLYSCKY